MEQIKMEQIKNNQIDNLIPIEEEKNKTEILTLKEAERAIRFGYGIREELLEELKLIEGEEAKKKCNNICAEISKKEFNGSASEAEKHIFHWVLCAEAMRRYKEDADKLIYDITDRVIIAALTKKLIETRMRRRAKMKKLN